MQIIEKFIMFNMIVSDMPKAKEFYVDKLGLEVKKDYRQDDDHWWVSLTLPEGEVTITLTTYHKNMKLGNISIYFTTSDITTAHKELSERDVKVNKVQDDLYGPGSGVKFIKFEDPDGNWIHIAQS